LFVHYFRRLFGDFRHIHTHTMPKRKVDAVVDGVDAGVEAPPRKRKMKHLSGRDIERVSKHSYQNTKGIFEITA